MRRPPFSRYLADHNGGKKAIKSKNSKGAYVMQLRARQVIDKKSARGAFFYERRASSSHTHSSGGGNVSS
jgi:hypothetical protein